MIKIGARRRKAFIAMLGALCAAMIITGYAQTQKVDSLSTQVSMFAQKAVYETQELLAGLQLNLQKLLVSNSKAHRQSILDDIIKQSEAAADDLSMITWDMESVEGAIKFVNQTGDYASAMSRKISLGDDLDQTDINQISSMLSTCVSLNAEIIEGIRKLENGEIEVEFADTTNETEVEPAVNYPVLLYDGPFSDAVGDENFVPFGDEVTVEDASDALRRFIGEDRVKSINYTGTSDIMSKCYEFEVELNSERLSAGVTAMGGHVLYMLAQSDVVNERLSREECIQNGLDFLSSRGFGDMSVSFWRKQDGILTVNYAPVMNGVVLYPDLVKLQISLESGEIIGAETGNYIRNHIQRVINQPVVTEQDAMSHINPIMSISGIQLCVIPLDKTEHLCWEVYANFDGNDTYLIYIDAITGQERTILQLVESDEGVLTQ